MKDSLISTVYIAKKIMIIPHSVPEKTSIFQKLNKSRAIARDEFCCNPSVNELKIWTKKLSRNLWCISKICFVRIINHVGVFFLLPWPKPSRFWKIFASRCKTLRSHLWRPWYCILKVFQVFWICFECYFDVTAIISHATGPKTHKNTKI